MTENPVIFINFLHRRLVKVIGRPGDPPAIRDRRLASKPGQLITLKISAQIEISARLA